jgi:acyl-coenzyme A synthetase/AMP-(fatty) acid ligase
MVADPEGRPVAPGETGELLIRVESVMAGYWRPSFAADAREGAMKGLRRDEYYRTGDLVRSAAGGNYMFLGRKDRQVKARGYRIELDEIEGVLASHPEVDEAVVFLRGEAGEQREIEAVAAVKPGAQTSAAHLLTHVARQVPAYAVPARIRVVESLPRTSTGKVDRQALANDFRAAAIS